MSGRVARSVTEDVPTQFSEELRAERIDIRRVEMDRERSERPEIRVDTQGTRTDYEGSSTNRDRAGLI